MAQKLYLGNIAVSCTISEINAFMQKFKMAAKYSGNTIFRKKLPEDSVDTPGLKNFAEIVLPHTISKINGFMHFTQTFKMATKNGGKTIFGKHS